MEFFPSVFGHIEVRVDSRDPRRWAAPAGREDGEMRRETFHTPGTLTLDVRVPSGEISFESVDGETTVELDVSGASDAVRELLESARIELSPARRRPRGGRRRSANGGAGLRSLRPSRLPLACERAARGGREVSTASADVDGRGRFGGLRAELASGRPAFCGDVRPAEVKSASGDVSPRKHRRRREGFDCVRRHADRPVEGQATLRSASGDVTVDEANRLSRCRRPRATSASGRSPPGASRCSPPRATRSSAFAEARASTSTRAR